jgi:flavin reductase (DIM6/NTAB) family NADH-FMN oxidoreductase RutF
MTDDDDIRATFKAVMARVATPVSIVTTVSDGCPHGTTVSAFTSLSMEPPMVLVSLDRNSDTLAGIQHTRRFGLNILGSHQAAIAATFAQKGGTAKFDDTPWTLVNDLPRLPESSGWIACTVADLVDGGDHVIALGLVDAADLCEAPPLVYHARTFGTHAPH